VAADFAEATVTARAPASLPPSLRRFAARPGDYPIKSRRDAHAADAADAILRDRLVYAWRANLARRLWWHANAVARVIAVLNALVLTPPRPRRAWLTAMERLEELAADVQEEFKRATVSSAARVAFLEISGIDYGAWRITEGLRSGQFYEEPPFLYELPIEAADIKRM
jgi:hypothetical protein